MGIISLYSLKLSLRPSSSPSDVERAAQTSISTHTKISTHVSCLASTATKRYLNLSSCEHVYEPSITWGRC